MKYVRAYINIRKTRRPNGIWYVAASHSVVHRTKAEAERMAQGDEHHICTCEVHIPEIDIYPFEE